MAYGGTYSSEFSDFKLKMGILSSIVESVLSEDKRKVLDKFIQFNIADGIRIKGGINGDVTYSIQEDLIVPSKLLGAAQTMALRETESSIKYMAYIVYSGSTSEYVKANYADVEVVIEDDLESRYLNIIREMYTSGLPLSKNLIRAYDESVRMEYLKLSNDSVLRRLTAETGASKSDIESIKSSKSYLCKLVEEYLKSTASKENLLLALKVGLRFNKTYNSLSNYGSVGIESFRTMVDANRKTVYYVNNEVERLATVKEIKKRMAGVYTKVTYVLEDAEDKKYLMLLGWCTTGDTKYLKFAGYSYKDTEYDTLECIMQDIVKMCEFVDGIRFREEIIAKLFEASRPVVYPKKADDELLDDKLVAMLRYVKFDFEPKNDYHQIAVNIATSALKYKNYDLSEKQYAVVKGVYDFAIGKDEDKLNKYNADLVLVMDEILKDDYLKKDEIVYKIIQSVKKVKRCSDKQYIIINEYYEERVLKEKSNDRKVVEIDTDVKVLKGKKAGTVSSVEEKRQEKRQEVGKEKKTKAKSSSILGLSDMSDMLGVGGGD